MWCNSFVVVLCILSVIQVTLGYYGSFHLQINRKMTPPMSINRRNQIAMNAEVPNEFKGFIDPAYIKDGKLKINPDIPSSGKSDFSKKVPFSEDMYKTIKRAIELLSARSTNEQPLSIEDAKWLKDAVDVIIEDAHKQGPPPPPPRATQPPPAQKKAQ